MVEELTGAEEICEELLVSRRRLQGTMVSQMRRLGRSARKAPTQILASSWLSDGAVCREGDSRNLSFSCWGHHSISKRYKHQPEYMEWHRLRLNETETLDIGAFLGSIS